MNEHSLQQHELLKALISDSRHTFLVVAQNNRIIATNRADPPFGWQSTVGKSVYDLFTPRNGDLASHAMKITYRTGRQAYFEAFGISDTQKITKYAVTVLPVIREDIVISVILRVENTTVSHGVSWVA